MKTIFIFFLVFIFIASNFSFVFAQVSSTNYKIYGGQVNPQTGASSISSTNYGLKAGGNPISGIKEGSDYNVQSGSAFSREAGEDAGTVAGVSSSGGGGPIGGTSDSIPPVITNLEIVNITASFAVINFNTNEDVVADFIYGKNSDFNLETGFGPNFQKEHSFMLGDLSASTAYEFKIIVKDKNQNERVSKVYSFITLPIIQTISNVSNFNGTFQGEKIVLSWKNPNIFGLAGIIISRSELYFPSIPEEGKIIFNKIGEQYEDEDIDSNKKYYYSVFVYNKNEIRSSGATVLVSTMILDDLSEESGEPEKLNKIEDVNETIDLGDNKKPEIPDEVTDEEAYKEIIPAEEPELPDEFLPIPEENKIKDKFIRFFTLSSQRVAKGYFNLSQFFSGISKSAKKQIDLVKEGLINEFGQLEQDVYQELTLIEKEKIEKIIQRPLPPVSPLQSYREISKLFSGLTNETSKKIESIKEGLIKKTNEVNFNVYEKLTDEEKKEIEKIIQSRLPEDFQKISDVFKNISDDAIEKVNLSINSSKEKLISQKKEISQNLYDNLTPEEKKQAENILFEELPSTFSYDTVVNIAPFSISAKEGFGADYAIFAGAEAIISIPADIFSKKVETITASIESEAYVLYYNETGNAYEAIIKAPEDKGKYQVIVQIIYEDHSYEEIHKVVLVDPYGIIYTNKRKKWNWQKPWEFLQTKKVAVPFANLTLYTLNKTGGRVVWPAHLYNQFNPILSNEDGQYAFVVPPGEYYIEAEAFGFEVYRSKIFTVKQEAININIELIGEKAFPWHLVMIFLIFVSFVSLVGFIYIFRKSLRKYV